MQELEKQKEALTSFVDMVVSMLKEERKHVERVNKNTNTTYGGLKRNIIV